MDDILDEILEGTGWTTDGLGDEVLICPCGNRVEQDGECPNGHVSPLVEMGII